MACALTSNVTIDCRDSIGGAKNIWILESSKVLAVTGSNTTQVITGIQTSGSVAFWRYQFLPEKAGFTEAITVSDNGNVYYVPTVTMILNKLQAATSAEIRLLAANTNLKVAVQEAGGNVIFLGKQNGLSVADGGSMGIGTAFGDLHGYNITLTGGEPDPAYFVTGSIIGTFFPGST